ncbi:MAG: esterase family protein [Muribaculaceae bacterium]|nr:esterase family protein [Muribaculaceae bacterium]
MKKTLMLSLSLITVMMLMATTACAHTVPQQQGGIEMAAPEEGSQVDTIEVMSQAMGRIIKNVVVVPNDYHSYANEIADDIKYPVLYLLHGAYGSYRDWPHKADLQSLASQYQVIIVCPDGQDSWYFDSPVDPKMQFETYISKELVAYIDSHYRTHANRYMRAITGLSMGGHGALFLAFRHPDVFWSCGSMSGCMDITQHPKSWHIKDRLGDYESDKQRWSQHAVCNQVDQLKASTLEPAQNITFDDGLNDIFIKNNIALHEQLVEKGIDHDFTVRPGRHSWDYWVNSLDYHLLFFHKAFTRGYQLMNGQSTDN